MAEERKKILVVEDDASVRKILKKELEGEGLEILEAANGEEAIEIAFSSKPDLVLLDVIMPKMHGIDMLRKLEADDWGKNVPVIILTNYADDPRVIEAIKSERIDLLEKSKAKLDVIKQKIFDKIK